MALRPVIREADEMFWVFSPPFITKKLAISLKAANDKLRFYFLPTGTPGTHVIKASFQISGTGVCGHSWMKVLPNSSHWGVGWEDMHRTFNVGNIWGK